MQESLYQILASWKLFSLKFFKVFAGCERWVEAILKHFRCITSLVQCVISINTLCDVTCSLSVTYIRFSKVSDDRKPGVQMARILQYLECPQYLRKSFFPQHKDLEFAGQLVAAFLWLCDFSFTSITLWQIRSTFNVNDVLYTLHS